MPASPSFLLLSILQSLRAGKRTAALLVLGFAVGLLLPTAILAAARHELLALHNGTMADARRIIRLDERPAPEPVSARPGSGPSEAELSDILRNLDPAVESVSRRSEYSGILHDGRKYRFVYILTVDPSYIDLFRRYIRLGGVPDGGRACIVGTALAMEMWGGSGIGREIRAGTAACTVTGETDVHARRVIVVETEETYRGWTQFFVKAKDPGDADRILAKIRETAGGHWKAERMDVVERRERARARGAYAAAVLVSLATLLYALLNIGNVMGLMMRERRRKHGIQLALGARPRTIRAEYFGELLLMTTASLVMVFAALKTAQPLVERHLFSMRLDPAVLLSVFAFNLLICATASVVLVRRIRRPGIIRLIRESE